MTPSSSRRHPTRSSAVEKRKSLAAIGLFAVAYLALLLVVVAPPGTFVAHQLVSVGGR